MLWQYNKAMIILYYDSCPNCKNAERNLVREIALQKSIEYDDRYVLALPDIWGAETARIGTKLPFLYDPSDETSLALNAEKDGMRGEIEKFLDKGNSD